MRRLTNRAGLPRRGQIKITKWKKWRISTISLRLTLIARLKITLLVFSLVRAQSSSRMICRLSQVSIAMNASPLLLCKEEWAIIIGMKMFKLSAAKAAGITLSLRMLNPISSKRIDSKNFSSNIKGCWCRLSYQTKIRAVLVVQTENLKYPAQISLQEHISSIPIEEICWQVST